MTIAVFMVWIAVIEMIHIPSGHLINTAGEFQISKNFQLLSCVVLVIGMATCGALWGVYGMLGAILMVAVLLAVLEMGYVHIHFFRGKLLELMRLLMPLAVAGIVTCMLERQLIIRIEGYLAFIAYGVLFVCAHGVVAVILGIIFNRRELTAFVSRVLRIFSR